MATASFPNIAKLEAVLRELGSHSVRVSWQLRDATDPTGFFTVTRSVTNATRGCSIGQGDTLAEAFEAEAVDYQAITKPVSIAKLEKAAA